jgi:ribosomal protein L37AE/L43A
MVQDSAHFLNELPIWKLKIVAQAFNIDVSACRYKRDFIDKVKSKKLTQEQVRKALASKSKKPQTEKTDSDEPGRSSENAAVQIKAVARDIEQIAGKPTETTELPLDEEKNVERNLDEALLLKPSFFDVDSASQSAYNRMILGDFYGAIKINRETRLMTLETFSNAQVYSTAVSIRAADELLSRLTAGNHPASSTLKTALAAAKRAFINGPPRQREVALESLESLVEKAYEAFAADTESEEGELKELLADYESFGTRTDEARKYLEIAAQAKSAFNIGDYAKFLEEARKQAEDAKTLRAKEIDEGFSLVRAAAEEAREAGAEMATSESSLEKAREAFESGSFKQAIELLSSVERAVDDAHLAQLRAQKDLEAKQIGKVKVILGSCEPMLLEASSYGLGVQEGLYHVACAKAALGSRDVVKAVKHARRLKEVASPVEKDVDLKRLELGIVRHVDGVKCTSCGQESLYAHPNGTQKCFECGQSYQGPATESAKSLVRVLKESREDAKAEPQKSTPGPTAPAAQTGVETKTEPERRKKKGFFRW